jgi:magnesium transporter
MPTVSRFYKKTRKKAGVSPGTLLPVAEQKMDKVRMRLFDYDAGQYQEKELQRIEEAFPFKDKPTVTWLNIDGLHDVTVVEKIGQQFNLHPLVLEDILNVAGRPKIESYDAYIYVVTKMLRFDEKAAVVQGEQLSMILAPDFVITFQEIEGDSFEMIRQRIRTDDSRMRKNQADYLAYRLLDTVVDHYFTVLAGVGEDIESLEVELMAEASHDTLSKIHRLKGELLYLRRSVWPLREVVNGLTRTETELIRESTGVYLRDVYDHTIQIIDTIESFRDIVSGMLDTYLSLASNKMNEVMKVLTIIATIFIPLTFIAGIYGMNFKFIPELEWQWGYAGVWVIMLTVGIVMVSYFKRKNWL